VTVTDEKNTYYGGGFPSIVIGAIARDTYKRELNEKAELNCPDYRQLTETLSPDAIASLEMMRAENEGEAFGEEARRAPSPRAEQIEGRGFEKTRCFLVDPRSAVDPPYLVEITLTPRPPSNPSG